MPAIAGRSPLLRLQGDEKLIAQIRKGNHAAFDVLVQRYTTRLLAFCRHMLGSTEDAEDVLQEVFAAAFNAICADSRPINARPWLYRIARNRCLNHLRRPVPNGQDSMDIFERDGGQTTADAVHKREEFRQIVADVQELPETQKTALLLREMDALSYEHIAEAMDTTVPSVKSLLVRARVSLAEAAEARLLSCAEVRLELGQVAEGLTKTSAPVRRHLRGCDRCSVFRGELRRANRALAAIYPVGPMLIFKKLLLTKLGIGAGATTGGSGAGIAGGAAAAGGGGGAGAGGILTAGVGTIATKAAAGFAAAALVTAGAVEVHQQAVPRRHAVQAAAAPADAQRAPVVLAAVAQPQTLPAPQRLVARVGSARPERVQAKAADAVAVKHAAKTAHKPAAPVKPLTPAVTPVAQPPAAGPSKPAVQPVVATQPPSGASSHPAAPVTQEGSSTVTVSPEQPRGSGGQGPSAGQPSSGGGSAQAPPPGSGQPQQQQGQPGSPPPGQPVSPPPPGS